MSQPSCTVRNADGDDTRRRAVKLGELLVPRKFRFDDAFTFVRDTLNQLGQTMIALRTDDEIDRWLPRRDLGPLGLRHAARNGDDRVLAVPAARVLDVANAAQIRIDLLCCLLADVAGIEDHEIGGLEFGRLGVPLARQRFGHALAVVDVHLASERLQIETFANGVIHVVRPYPGCALSRQGMRIA